MTVRYFTIQIDGLVIEYKAVFPEIDSQLNNDLESVGADFISTIKDKEGLNEEDGIFDEDAWVACITGVFDYLGEEELKKQLAFKEGYSPLKHLLNSFLVTFPTVRGIRRHMVNGEVIVNLGWLGEEPEHFKNPD